MKSINFYRLTTTPIEKAAVKLIEKIYYSKEKLLVIGESENLMRLIDDSLWSYSTKHFIPHGTYTDDYPERQPIYLTIKPENPNNSSVAMALGNVDLDLLAVEKYIHMFDGNNQSQLEFARNKWKTYSNKDYDILYWQQNLQGTWEKQNQT